MIAYEHRTPDVTLTKFKNRKRLTYPNRQLKCSPTVSILQYMKWVMFRSEWGRYRLSTSIWVLYHGVQGQLLIWGRNLSVLLLALLQTVFPYIVQIVSSSSPQVIQMLVSCTLFKICNRSLSFNQSAFVSTYMYTENCMGNTHDKEQLVDFWDSYLEQVVYCLGVVL